VDACKEYIAAGDILPSCPVAALRCGAGVDPFLDLSLAADRESFTLPVLPAFGLNKLADTHIVGSSPELLVRVNGD